MRLLRVSPGFGSPGSVRHLVGVVVQADDGLPLLYAGQYRHQGGVGHHQVQVVLGQVKVHRLRGNILSIGSM